MPEYQFKKMSYKEIYKLFQGNEVIFVRTTHLGDGTYVIFHFTHKLALGEQHGF